MLVTLKLSNTTLVDTSSSPALKKLSLVHMKYPSENFVMHFLSSCPVLEDLVVDRCHDDNVVVLPVIVPSLRRLYLSRSTDTDDEDKAAGFVVDAPLLESLDIHDHNDRGLCYIRENMPEIEYANLDVNYYIFLWLITSVTRLYLCSSTRTNAYPENCVFHRLVHLTLCTCGRKFLLCLLRDSPKLQVLRFEQCHELLYDEPRPCCGSNRAQFQNV